MSQLETTELSTTVTPVPFCKRYGFCTNMCEQRDNCSVMRTKLLIHCLIVSDDRKTYYPVEYINDLPQYPQQIQITSSIVAKCSGVDCSNNVFYSRNFYDANVGYTAGLKDRRFFIYCSNECRQKYIDQLVIDGYRRANKK